MGRDFVVEPLAALFDGADDEEIPEVVGAVEEVFNAEEVLTGVPRGGCGFEASVAGGYEVVPRYGVFLL